MRFRVDLAWHKEGVKGNDARDSGRNHAQLTNQDAFACPTSSSDGQNTMPDMASTQAR